MSGDSQQVSNLWSCESLDNGLDHFDKSFATDEELRLMQELQDCFHVGVPMMFVDITIMEYGW